MSTPKKKIFLENKRSYSIRSKDSNCISNNKKPSKPTISKGPWKSPENQLLLDWINKNGPRNWTKCAEIIKGRTGKQCREHWNNSLNREIKKGDWSVEEDLLIMVFHKKFNGSWKKMIPLFKSRTENSIKNRFFSQLRKIASKYIKKGKRVYSTKFGLETLLNFYDMGLEEAKKHFLKNSNMNEKELEVYIKSIENKLKKNPKKGEKFIDLSSLRNNKNKVDNNNNNIKLNESEDELNDKPNNIKNKETTRKKNKYKKIKKENSSEKVLNDIDITIKLDNQEEPPIQNIEKEKEKTKDICNNIPNDFNKNSNNDNNKNNIDKISTLNPINNNNTNNNNNNNNNSNNNLNNGLPKIPINNNNTYNNNFNNVSYTNYNTNFSTLNIDNNMINKNENVNAINNANNSQYTLSNLRSGAIFYNNNFSNKYKVEFPIYNNNLYNKKSSDLSDYAKHNECIGMDNYEAIPKPTNFDVLKLLNSYNSNNLNDNNDQNNYMNYNGLQSRKISNLYEDKKSFPFTPTPTPMFEKKISYSAFKNSESFDLLKGPTLFEPQFSQSGFKRCTSNISL